MQHAETEVDEYKNVKKRVYAEQFYEKAAELEVTVDYYMQSLSMNLI